MRSEEEIKNILLDFAIKDDRVMAVLLNGSRANPNAVKDNLQDFDIIFIADDLLSFTKDHSWTNFLGDTIVKQLPDEVTFGISHKEQPIDFHYLMLFEDGVRIDLTLFPFQKIHLNYKPDSLTIVWLDKAALFAKIPTPSDRDYYIIKPSEKEFLDICNEFWWVSTYVAKGLIRNETTYAKEILEMVVRPMFMKIIEWKIGIDNNFSVSFGKAGKFMAKYLPEYFTKSILATYSNADTEANWKSLFIMTDIFVQTSGEVAEKLYFNIDTDQEERTIKYLIHLYEMQKSYN